ncbi:Nitroreductase family protein [compost metagenome]
MSLSNLGPELHSSRSFSGQPVPQQLVLELLNDAVWAPNDGLREPWRFIYADNSSGGRLSGLQEPAPAYLIMVMKEESDSYKRDEDFAAVCCLMQNFQLLACERKLGVRRTMNDWIYDRKHMAALGVQDKERIAAVLEIGFWDEAAGEVPSAKVTEVKFELL